MPIASNLSYIGVAKEATPGTAVAATAFIPVANMKPVVKVMYLEDNALRGANAKIFDEVQGITYSEYEFDGPVYADTIGYPLAGVLGDVTTTGASAPFSHAIALGNSAQPTSYTISDYNGFNTRQFAGSKFSSVGLKFAGNGLLEYTAKTVGTAFATTSKPTQSFSSVRALPNWLAVTTIGASASTLVVEGNLDIKRSVEAIHNLDGTQSPYSIFSGGDLTVSGSFKAVYEDDTIYTNYLAGTQHILDFNWSQGAGASLVQVKIHMTKAQIVDATVVRSQGKYVELDCKFETVANTTDVGGTGGYSPVKVTIQNALAASTFV